MSSLTCASKSAVPPPWNGSAGPLKREPLACTGSVNRTCFSAPWQACHRPELGGPLFRGGDRASVSLYSMVGAWVSKRASSLAWCDPAAPAQSYASLVAWSSCRVHGREDCLACRRKFCSWSFSDVTTLVELRYMYGRASTGGR